MVYLRRFDSGGVRAMSREFSFNYDDSTDEKKTMGANGEAVFADAIGGRVADPSDGDDGGVDVIGPNGYTYDVKTTDRNDANLLVRADRKKYHDNDRYAFVHIRNGKYLVEGWISADDAYAYEPREYPTWINNHVIPPNELHDISDIKRKVSV